MMPATEVLDWWEKKATERSDESFKALRKFELVERGTGPLNLTDTEILDWLDEYCDQAVYNRPTPEFRGGFTLYCYDIRTNGPTLREAVCLAAAKWKEANE